MANPVADFAERMGIATSDQRSRALGPSDRVTSAGCVRGKPVSAGNAELP